MPKLFLCAAFAIFVAAQAMACECPPAALSRRVLLSIPKAGTSGLVVCGDEASEKNGVLMASNFEVFSCGAHESILYFDAILRARLETRRGRLRVVEIGKLPFGRNWQWLDVPLIERRLKPSDTTAPPARLVVPMPSVTASQIRAFLTEYQTLLASGRAADEEVVSKLFTAAMSGHARAAALYKTMPQDAHLDGAAGEIYSGTLEVFEMR